MSLIVLNEIKNKDEILEQLIELYEFQDEYIDSYTQEIATKISKETNIEIDAFSDQVWLNSYIIFKKGDLDIFKISFDNYVKSFEDEEPIESFKDTITQLNELLSTTKQITVLIEYQENIGG